MTIIFVAIIIGLVALGYATGGVAAVTVASPQLPTSPNSLAQITATVPMTVKPSAIVQSNVTFGYKSDGSLTGAAITNNVNTWPGNDAYDAICTAVALAEGYNQGSGAAPYDLNNPGDLSPGDEAGEPTCGSAQYHGGSNVIFFCTVENGWTALRTKFQNIVAGNSSVYSDADSWAVVAGKYAGNSAAWLSNVTNYLGVDSSTTPADYVNGAA